VYPTAGQPWDTGGVGMLSAPEGAVSGVSYGRNRQRIVLDSVRAEPDVAPTGLINSSCRVLPHGWLAVG
jgi:hypothetical protein